jgi:luciferase family oxidoreductase group 1
MVPLSVLDLAFVSDGAEPADALRQSLSLAQHVEQWGYRRFWLAEHHNMIGIASAATAVAIGYVAGGTRTIRVGAGGVMLPNHAPLIIAEQFGTLEALYPGRIDLGLGRAPGTDRLTVRALRRHTASAEHFPQDVLELQALLAAPAPGQPVRAVPGAGLEVPLWILGSSLYGAELAAALGLPYAFASHFAPAMLDSALEIYRRQFRPSKQLEHPYAMVAAHAVAARDTPSAQRLFTSAQQSFTNLLRGKPGKLPAPIDDIESYWSTEEKRQAESMLSCAAVGDPATASRRLRALAERTAADELMIVAAIYDHGARLRSYELLAEAWALAA